MGKKHPQLRLVKQESQSDIFDEHPSPEAAFDIVSKKALSSAERSHIDRVISSICPEAGIIGVAKTPRSWDLRPVIKLSGESSPSVIRFFGPEVALSESITTRVKDTLKLFDSYPDLRALIVDHGVLEGQIWIRREFVDYTLEDLLRVDKPLSTKRAWNLTSNLLKAVGNWHARGIAHGHLTAANVGLSGVHNGRFEDDLTLMDAGVGASCVQAAASIGLEQFPKGYLQKSFAPEVIEGEAVRFSADVYSLGRIFNQIFSRVYFEQGQIGRFKKSQEFFSSMSSAKPADRPELTRVLAELSSSIEPLTKKKKKTNKVKQSAEAQVYNKNVDIDDSHRSQVMHTESKNIESKDIAVSPVKPRQGNEPSNSRARVKRDRQGTALMRPGVRPKAGGSQPNNQANNPSNKQLTTRPVVDPLKARGAVVRTKEEMETFSKQGRDLQKMSTAQRKQELALREHVLRERLRSSQEALRATAVENSRAQPSLNKPTQMLRQANINPVKLAQNKPAHNKQTHNESKQEILRRSEKAEATPAKEKPEELEVLKTKNQLAKQKQDPENAEQLSQFEEEARVRQLAEEAASLQENNFIQEEAELHAHAKDLVHDAHKGSNLFFWLIAAGVMMLAFIFYQRSSSTEPEIEVVSPTGYSELQLSEFWRSGLHSKMKEVARVAVDPKSSQNEFALSVIVGSARTGSVNDAGFNAELLRIAFDPRWEKDLSMEDRRTVVALATGPLMGGELHNNPQSIHSFHAAVILALVASGGDGYANILKGFPIDRLYELPAPVSAAFRLLGQDEAISNAYHPAVRTLGRLATRGVLPGFENTEELHEFISRDSELRVRALALLYSSDSARASRALNAILGHVSLRPTGDNISWAIAHKLSGSDWRRLSPVNRLMVLSGALPEIEFSTSQIQSLLLHPFSEVRAQAIGLALDKYSWKHRGAIPVLKAVRKHSSSLSALQTAQLVAMVSDPDRISDSIVKSWLATKPPRSIVKELLLSSVNAEKSNKLDVYFSRYLEKDGWQPRSKELRQLVLHPSRVVRMRAYDQTFKMDNAEVAMDILRTAKSEETDLGFIDDLTEKIEFLATQS